MADELDPLETPITAGVGPITITAKATATITAATAPTLSLENPNPCPPLAPKRQRRPSVRLGEIGHQPAATLSYESHVRRAKQQAWRLGPKESSTPSNSGKAWSLTSLFQGNGDGVNLEFGNRRVKGKRGTAVKRVRSNSEAEEEEEEEGFRELDPEWNEVQSMDKNVELWNGFGPRENDNQSSSSGVRSWLIELGLSRYAPVFEIHEVDDEVLPMLTLEDLKDMGINAVGSRRKIFTAILKLRNRFSHVDF